MIYLVPVCIPEYEVLVEVGLEKLSPPPPAGSITVHCALPFLPGQLPNARAELPHTGSTILVLILGTKSSI